VPAQAGDAIGREAAPLEIEELLPHVVAVHGVFHYLQSVSRERSEARARDSLKQHGLLDDAASEKLGRLLRYVDGDYQDPATFEALRAQLGKAQRPAHYLAIPPVLFGPVVEQLARSGCAKNARVIVEKPFGNDLGSAQGLNRTLLGSFDEKTIFRIDHYLGKRPVHHMLFFRFANPFLSSFWDRNHVESVQLTMAENFGIQGRGAFYDQTGTIRDVVQNHLFQVLSNLAMEPPVRADSESIRDEKVKVLKAIPALRPEDVVRGQFRGYRTEKGVAAIPRRPRAVVVRETQARQNAVTHAVPVVSADRPPSQWTSAGRGWQTADHGNDGWTSAGLCIDDASR